MNNYIYVPAYYPLSNGGYQQYWALVNAHHYFKTNMKPMKRYVFRIPLRPDSWNNYAITQNATSKKEAIQYIMNSFNELYAHYNDPNYEFFNTINNIGLDTITYECILKHYTFIMEELDRCKPEVYNIHATEWVASLA